VVSNLNHRRNIAVSLIAAVLSGALIYAVYVLQIKQVEVQKKIHVVVPKDFIQAGTVLAKGDVATRAIFVSSYDRKMFTRTEDVIGKQALIPLGTGEPILNWKVSSFYLLPGKSQLTFQIPKAFILSISSGVRAGDLVMIYISDPAGTSSQVFEERVRVASVKSAANHEVDDPENSRLLSMADNDTEKMLLSRRFASAPIDHINLNLTNEQWLLIDRLCKDGKAKLVIALSSETAVNQ
jgi:Flp pilus assembly protein CpaB